MTSFFTKEIWKALYKMAKDHDLHELSLGSPDETITIRRGVRAVTAAVELPVETEAVSVSERKGEEIPQGHFVKVTSPLSGVFYRAPAPGAEPFVIEGEKVQFGDGLCIIEAMKVLNEITSETAGTIYKIVPQNGDVVNEGDLLFLIEPESSG